MGLNPEEEISEACCRTTGGGGGGVAPGLPNFGASTSWIPALEKTRDLLEKAVDEDTDGAVTVDTGFLRAPDTIVTDIHWSPLEIKQHEKKTVRKEMF